MVERLEQRGSEQLLCESMAKWDSDPVSLTAHPVLRPIPSQLFQLAALLCPDFLCIMFLWTPSFYCLGSDWLMNSFMSEILRSSFAHSKEEFMWCACYDHKETKNQSSHPGQLKVIEWNISFPSCHQKTIKNTKCVPGLCWGWFSAEWKLICISSKASNDPPELLVRFTEKDWGKCVKDGGESGAQARDRKDIFWMRIENTN